MFFDDGLFVQLVILLEVLVFHQFLLELDIFALELLDLGLLVKIGAIRIILVLKNGRLRLFLLSPHLSHQVLVDLQLLLCFEQAVFPIPDFFLQIHSGSV